MSALLSLSISWNIFSLINVYFFDRFRFVCLNFPHTPMVLVDNMSTRAASTADSLPRGLDNLPEVTEVKFVGLGQRGRRPVLLARFSDHEVIFCIFSHEFTECIVGTVYYRLKKSGKLRSYIRNIYPLIKRHLLDNWINCPTSIYLYNLGFRCLSICITHLFPRTGHPQILTQIRRVQKVRMDNNPTPEQQGSNCHVIWTRKYSSFGIFRREATFNR